MAKSLQTIQAQIQKLQEQANSIKAKEAVGVIAKIKDAIAFYQLTADDLFGESAAPVKKTRKKRSVVTDAKPAKKEKKPSVAKYTDGGDKTWSGHGKRPGWFVSALAEGRTAEDLLIKR